MTKLQQIRLQQVEAREKLRGLIGTERTDEQETEFKTLTDRLSALDTEERAAILADGEQPQGEPTDAADPETRERLELRGKLSLGGWLAAQLGEKSGLDVGALAEYRAACKVDRPGLPLDLFEQDRPAPSPEERAVTPAPTTGTGQTVAPVQPFVFAPSIAPRLGIDMPSVPSGGFSEMTISTALTPMPEAKGDAADGTAAALTAVSANPRRISARLSLAIEDIAQVGVSNFEAALRAHTSMALSHAYDNQVINGNSTSPNINGLINQLTNPTDPTAVTDFGAFVQSFSDQIDGLWALMMSDVGIVTNVDAYKLAARTFRGDASAGGPAVTFADYAKMSTGGFWTNSRMPATAATLARGIVYRMGRPGIRTACHPTWGTLSIDDIYTDSASGQRHFTVHVLCGDKVLLVQPSAYSLVEYKVS